MIKHPQIKKDGDSLVLVFASRRGSDLTHSTAFPITEKGIDQLIRVLSAIEAQPAGETFATESEPIQYMVEQWLKTNTVTRRLKPEIDPLIVLAKEFCPPKEDHLVFLKDNREFLEQELIRRTEFASSIDFDLEDLL
jgi:hypothetical protein